MIKRSLNVLLVVALLMRCAFTLPIIFGPNATSNKSDEKQKLEDGDSRGDGDGGDGGGDGGGNGGGDDDRNNFVASVNHAIKRES